MAIISKQTLSKKYESADIDFAIMMIENRLVMARYMAKKESQIKETLSMHKYEIIDLYTKEMRTNADGFLYGDMSYLRKKETALNAIIKKAETYMLKEYIRIVSDVYNYQRLYYLWMIDVKVDGKADYHKKPESVGEMVVGESTSDDESVVNDPGFTKSILKQLVSDPIYTRNIQERLDYAKENAIEYVDKLLTKAMTVNSAGTMMDYDDFLLDLEEVVDSQLINRYSQALRLGMEFAENLGEGLVFDGNSYFIRKFQRVEILDPRTCRYCAAIDGLIGDKRIGKVHPRCRGMDVPCTLNDDGSIAYREGLRGRRRREDSLDRWFGGLSESNKKSIFGKARYEKYQNGDMTFEGLFRSKRPSDMNPAVRTTERTGRFKNIAANSLETAEKLISRLRSKLAVGDISSLRNIREARSYGRFLDDKKSILSSLSNTALKKAGIKRSNLLDAVRQEKTVLSKREKDMLLKKTINKVRQAQAEKQKQAKIQEEKVKKLKEEKIKKRQQEENLLEEMIKKDKAKRMRKKK